MSGPARPGRGFTLVELLVSLLVSSIVVGGALILLTSQQRAFQSGSGDRALQEGGRVALERLTSELRIAGYGIDPGMAFDFGLATSPMDRAILTPGQSTVPFGGFECVDPVTCRDRVDAPDELVFHSRDPDFGKLVSKVSGTSQLDLVGPLNTPLLGGQILQVVCYSGDLFWAYVTVDKRVEPTTAASVSIPLRAGAADRAFGGQNAYLADSCFAGEVRAFKINRSRYLIETYREDGTLVAWGTPDARPYLMLDQGLEDADGQPLHSVVAADVEDLQVAYVFPLAPAGTQIRGAALGIQLKNQADGIDLAPTTIPAIALYSTPRLDVVRTTGHPSNLRAVRIGVVVRQPEGDQAVLEPSLPELFNRAEITRETHRRRVVFQTTVSVPNMESRGPTFPTYGQAGLAADAALNHGGG